MTTVIGPIQLYDTDSTERTGSQLLTNLSFDSRIYQRFYPLTYTKIRELRNDPTIQLARWAVLAPMIHTPWTYVSPRGEATEEMITFVAENVEPLRDWFLQQAVFNTLDFGWAPFEVVYEAYEGKVYIDKLKALLHDYTYILVYLNNGEFAGFANEPLQLGASVVIAEEYACNINFSIEGTDWYGYSVFESLQDIISSWNEVEKSANRYDRKMAGATWVIYYPVGVTDYNGRKKVPNDEIARAVLVTLESSGTVAIPDEIQEWLDDTIDKEARGKWRIELISATSSTQGSFIDRQKYLDALKMRAFGLPERSVLEGTHGTKAEANVHSDVALSIVDSKHRLLVDQLNYQVIHPLMKLNYGEEYEYAVCVKPAPLVDTQFQTIRDIYRLILQTPDSLMHELPNIDLISMREKLGIETNNSPEPIPVRNDQLRNQE